MQDFESDLASLSAKRDFNRRQMLATSLAAGFAAAVQPVCAQTAITTDSNGLDAGEVRIPVSDGEIPAYRAMPEMGAPFPLVLVVQEIFGVHEHIKDICRRLAKEGYMAIAAELYARQGSVAGMTDIQDIIGKVVSKVPDAQVMSDLDAAVACAKATGHADTARLGITGFCWGGRITWLYAEHNAGLKAGVAWYGKICDLSRRRPGWRHDHAREPVVPGDVDYGEEDRRENGTHQPVPESNRVADDAGEERNRRENSDRLPVDGCQIERKLRHTYDPPKSPLTGCFCALAPAVSANPAAYARPGDEPLCALASFPATMTVLLRKMS